MPCSESTSAEMLELRQILDDATVRLAIEKITEEEMLRLDTEELNAGAYILRYTNIISNRFDTTTFKRLYADLYKDFTKAVSSRRFSVSC